MKGSKFFRIIRNNFIEPRYFLKGSCNVSDIDMGCGLGEKFSFLTSSKNFSQLKKISCIYLVVLYYTLIWGVGPWRKIFVSCIQTKKFLLSNKKFSPIQPLPFLSGIKQEILISYKKNLALCKKRKLFATPSPYKCNFLFHP